MQRNGLLSNHSLCHTRGYQALSLIYFQVPPVRDIGAGLNEGRVVCESKLSSPERFGELTRRLHYLHQKNLQLLVFLSDIGAFSSKQQKKQFWHRFRDQVSGIITCTEFEFKTRRELITPARRCGQDFATGKNFSFNQYHNKQFCVFSWESYFIKAVENFFPVFE